MVKKRFEGKIVIKPCKTSPDCLFIDGYKKPLEAIIKDSIVRSGSITSISYKVESEGNMVESLPFSDNMEGSKLNGMLEELKSYPGRSCILEINFSMISDKY
ncbi:MAG: hypothetical protein LUQ70_00970 [Methanobacteriaceae archaeon]|nr:hypothetical protein [Methanobacteriaceae archaeon]